MEAARPSYRFSFSMDEQTLMQSPNRAAAATQRETELQLLREAVQRLEQGPTFKKQIQERPEEKCTLIREIQDLKEMLEVKERRVNDLRNGMENLQEQLRDKEKQMGSLKGRVKSLQADTSNKESALTRLVESVAEKEHIIRRLNEQRFQDDQEIGEELVASRTMLEKMKVEHKMALEETAARHEAQSMDWSREREALKAQLLGLMKELEENQQVAQQLSFNVGHQPQPIETRQDRRGTAPPGRAAQPRRLIREEERRDRIRQVQEREEREHLIRKRNWLEVEKRRLDAECMELQFLEREQQCIRFERRRERYGIQRERVKLRRQQEQLRFGPDYRSGKRSYRFQGGHWPGRTNANTLSSHDPGCWSVRGAPSLHQRVEECGNPSLAQRPWRPMGQVVDAVYHRFPTDGASKNIGANH
ncbi:ELKS/Rab6-interacting/CAST family member 1-like [Gadus morhua]|uniref:ELKS/Rab6-interacting/CAST family member 1-like n=1 Tax=Gadus morhua TaxID=8049 RepID=UPI0011B73189|nr:ELKS/Rab6-interacting/CAST family member 1-like [Gadus morhua]